MEIVNCLTLPQVDDRILSISREAMRQGFPVYYHEGTFEEERRYVHIAITRGYKKIIKFAKDNKLKYCISCEDDCFFYGDNKAFQYFIDNIPPSYDLYMGCLYHGDVDNNNRVINGMSGSHTLIITHSRFYDFVLNEMPDNCYQDRYMGDFAHKYEYYVCPLIVCGQKAGYSFHKKSNHHGYEVYLENRKVYGRDTL
jgi:hypothetical protein